MANSKEARRLTTADDRAAQPLPYYGSYLRRIVKSTKFTPYTEFFSEYELHVWHEDGHIPGVTEPSQAVKLINSRVLEKRLKAFLLNQKFKHQTSPSGFFAEILPPPSRHKRKDVSDVIPDPIIRKSPRNHRAPAAVSVTSEDENKLFHILNHINNKKKQKTEEKTEDGDQKAGTSENQEQKTDGEEAAGKGGKGLGCYAARNFRPGEIVVIYLGERITIKEGLAREEQYKLEGRPQTMIFCETTSPKFCVDGQKKEDGSDYFGRKENPANLFNHSSRVPNCELIAEGTGKQKIFYLRTRRPIAKGCEMLWNYGDARQGLEQWYYK